MFRFTLQGRIGRIQELQKNTLRISLAADRLVEGRDGQWTATEWLSCVSFDAALNTQMLIELEKGQSVTLDGRIVPRVREVDANVEAWAYIDPEHALEQARTRDEHQVRTTLQSQVGRTSLNQLHLQINRNGSQQLSANTGTYTADEARNGSATDPVVTGLFTTISC